MTIAGRNTLKHLARKEERFDIDGQTFILREMSGRARDLFESNALKEVTDIIDGKPVTRRAVEPMLLRARLIALCWMDEEGRPVYGEDEVGMLADDISASVQGALFERAQKLNGLDNDAVEAARKNSAAAPSGDSPSA